MVQRCRVFRFRFAGAEYLGFRIQGCRDLLLGDWDVGIWDLGLESWG